MHFIHVYSAYLSSSLYPFRWLAAQLGTKARPLFRDTNYYAFTEADTRRVVCARTLAVAAGWIYSRLIDRYAASFSLVARRTLESFASRPLLSRTSARK